MSAVVCNDVVKLYRDVRAVDGVSFEIHEGEIFGMIGPNGAGKTTLMECVEGLRHHDSGRIDVLGHDPAKASATLKERIGIQLQASSLPARIKVREAFDLFASFYPRPVDTGVLLDRMGLTEKAGSYVAKLSGGQRQRAFIGLALINDPDLVFLDELTTGLDPQARLTMWDVIRDIRGEGKTVFLTTHFMDEAERLCDRVAIMDHGKIVALDTVDALIKSIGSGTKVAFSPDGPAPIAALEAVAGVTRVDEYGDQVIIQGDGDRLLQDVLDALSAAGQKAHNLKTEQPTLEDVFLTLTGRKLREGEN
jgi:ABC-2 type transport system ATP-binding protein